QMIVSRGIPQGVQHTRNVGIVLDARQKILIIQADIFNLRCNTNFAQTFQIQRFGAGIYLGFIDRYGYTVALIERKQRVY
ncbi:MAG TPA: hypothetical protein DHU81_15705, partial [Hyphomonas sp.]|nr:hypothetical protein [Hyphomonas sp.]